MEGNKMWRFNKTKLEQQLAGIYELQHILSKIEPVDWTCPYDGFIFHSDLTVTSNFWNTVKPASYFSNAGPDDRYSYMLSHPLFQVVWGRIYTNLPNTIIRINPDINHLTPSDMLDVITFILGTFNGVEVASWDEKIDIDAFTSLEVAERLFVGSQRNNPKVPSVSSTTIYWGKRNGQQVKVYDKAKQRGLKGKQLTRIERTRKIPKKNRENASYFLLNARNDGFKNMNMVDIDSIDGRSKIRRLIKAEGSINTAYKKLTRAEQKAFKKHPAYVYPVMDIQSVLSKDIEEWMRRSPLLPLKIITETCKEMSVWGGRNTLVAVECNPIALQTYDKVSITGWDFGRRYNTERFTHIEPIEL